MKYLRSEPEWRVTKKAKRCLTGIVPRIDTNFFLKWIVYERSRKIHAVDWAVACEFPQNVTAVATFKYIRPIDFFWEKTIPVTCQSLNFRACQIFFTRYRTISRSSTAHSSRSNLNYKSDTRVFVGHGRWRIRLEKNNSIGINSTPFPLMQLGDRVSIYFGTKLMETDQWDRRNHLQVQRTH